MKWEVKGMIQAQGNNDQFVADEGRRSAGGKVALTRALLFGAVALAPMVLGIESASAQGASEAGEIVVTAQRREQAIIDVPLSVSVISAQTVENQNLSTFTSVSDQSPNFNIGQNRGGNSAPDLTIRGIRGDGTNGRVNESSVAVYVDDVYLGDESMLSGQMYDVERVEVLRGPQGTLFGRNATGGLVQFVSASPTDHLSGKMSALYGSDDWVSLTAAVSGPLGPNIRTRLAGQYERHDGHFNNQAVVPNVPKKLGGKDVWSIRSTTDIDLNDDTRLRLQVSHSEADSESTPGYGLGVWDPSSPPTLCSRKDILAAKCIDGFVLAGLPAQSGRNAGDAITGMSRDNLRITSNMTSVTAKLEADFNGGTFISITNYTDFKNLMSVDAGANSTPFPFAFQLNVQIHNQAEQLSQEFRVQGTTKAIDWVGGVFYYQDKKNNQNILNLTVPFAVYAPSNTRVDTRSLAAFGQIDWHLNDQWTLGLGARYTDESRELKKSTFEIVTGPGAGTFQNILSAVAEPHPKSQNLTGKASLTWEPTPDNTVYASYSRGTRSAGFNVFYGLSSLAANASVVGPVGQERLDAFEIGSKNRFLDRRLTLNGAFFYYFYDGKQEQLNLIDSSSGAPVVLSQFINVGKAEIYGAELELAFSPTERWDFRTGVGLLHTEITDSDVVVSDPLLGAVPLEGLPIPQAPKWNVSGLVAYHVPTASMGRFTLQGEVNAEGKKNFDLSNNYLATAPSRVVANFRAIWESPDNRYNAQVFVTNVFNEAYFNDLSAQNIAQGNLTTQQAEPRLWGVKLGMSF